MATPAEALFAAALGLAGGVLGAAIVERLKASVASLDTEFLRLETFEDELFDLFALATDDPDRGTMLRQLSGRRRRLGLNIRRKVTDSVAYQACKAELVKFDGFLKQVEDGVPLNEALESEIEMAVIRLRSRLKRSSRMARAFAVLRGDA